MAPLLPPTMIDGRYAIVRGLGTGSSCDVVEVVDTHQGEHVALKLIHTVLGGAWNEAVILTALRDDDHILPVRNAALHLGQPYLVTALAGHGTVETAVPLGVGTDPEQAVIWARQLCRGTARTHDAGLLHTDIKPGNAFLTAAGNALLGDFGLACIPDPTTGHGHAFGTPETMAPEVCRANLGIPGGQGATPASDVYSLAATLRYALVGGYAHQRDPVADPAGQACMAEVAAGGRAPLADAAPHLPQGLVDRIDRAMHPDPAVRTQTPTLFAAALADWPRPPRSWRRTDEHGPAHAACWRGTKKGAAELVCCAEPAGRGFRIETRGPAGKRVLAACTTSPSTAGLPRAARRAFRAAG